MAASTLIQVARERGEHVLKKLDFVAPSVARLTLGVLFMSTGWGKVHSLPKVTAFFAELGIPAPGLNAHVVSFVELVGGALLLVGFASRLAALPLMASMLVAILTAQRDQVHGLPDLFGLVEWTYFALLLYIALTGPGRLSLDHLLFGRSRRRDAEERRERGALSAGHV
ncbi:MAG TPA: DoxX family protein [Polyangiaceae bacterium]|nr:DoxX family protein [Polyangiaceae bacterium]